MNHRLLSVSYIHIRLCSLRFRLVHVRHVPLSVIESLRQHLSDPMGDHGQNWFAIGPQAVAAMEDAGLYAVGHVVVATFGSARGQRQGLG